MTKYIDFPLKGKTAVITGSAKGIGAGIAQKFSGLGANIVINYRQSEKEAFRLQKELAETGNKSITVKADVTIPEEARRLIRKAHSVFGSVDILVNNAGDFLFRGIVEVTAEEWRIMLDSNLNSVFYCCREVIPIMREKKWGRIINIADMRAGKASAQPDKTAYIIAKTGILQLTSSLAVTEAPHGITVNAVSPGYIDCGNYSEKFMEKVLKDIPAGRLGRPEDIAAAAAFLISEEASYITGANLEVSGGAGI